MIGKSDIPEKTYWTGPIPIIEDMMVIENNRTKSNIRIVTLSEFACNYSIRRVNYGISRKRDMLLIDLKLRGECYFKDALPPDAIVKNARFLYCPSGLCEASMYSYMGVFLFDHDGCDLFIGRSSERSSVLIKWIQNGWIQSIAS